MDEIIDFNEYMKQKRKKEKEESLYDEFLNGIDSLFGIFTFTEVDPLPEIDEIEVFKNGQEFEFKDIDGKNLPNLFSFEEEDDFPVLLGEEESMFHNILSYDPIDINFHFSEEDISKELKEVLQENFKIRFIKKDEK